MPRKKSSKNELGCLIMPLLLCVCIGSFISNLKPTSTPIITLTSTSTKPPTTTLTPTIIYTPSITYTPTDTLTPTATATDTPPPPTTGFILIHIDETAHVGGVFIAKIQTQPEIQCNLTFYLPSGRQSTAGVGSKISDKDGYCSWFWEIRQNVKPGTGTIAISAGGQTLNYYIKIE